MPVMRSTISNTLLLPLRYLAARNLPRAILALFFFPYAISLETTRIII